MKKSFLKALVIVCFFCIVTIPSLSFAQTKVSETEWSEGTNNTEVKRINYTDGYSVGISRNKDALTLNRYTARFYRNGAQIGNPESGNTEYHVVSSVTNTYFPGSSLNPGGVDEAENGEKVDGILGYEQAIAGMFLTLANWIVSFTAFITGIVGKFFDEVVDFTIKNPGEFEGKFKTSIDLGWSIVRDLGNITIVFSLLYLGIRTIIQGNGFADRKTLAAIILAAVFINFSLFFTKIVFNISNTIGAQVFNQIKYAGEGSSASGESISGSIVRMLKGPEILSGFDANGQRWSAIWGHLQHGLLAGFSIISLAFIFLAAGAMLLYRSIVFLFLMITSPIGLVAKFIPWLKSAGDKWWSELKGQALFLPAFAVTMYICLFIIGEISKSGIGTFSSQESGATDMATFVFNFIMIIGFLLAILIVPLKVMGGGAGVMSNMGNWATNKIKSLPRSTAQFAGRGVASATARVGRASAAGISRSITTNEKWKTMARNESGLGGKFARTLLRQGEGLKEKTFDVRNTGLGSKLGLGKGIESYNSAVEAKKKKIEDRKKKEHKLFGYDKLGKTPEDKNEILQNEMARDAKGLEVEQKEKDLKAALQAQSAAIASGGTASASQIAAVSAARVAYDKEKKELEDYEKKVGELKSKGDSEHLKLIKARHSKSLGRLSLTQRKALENLEKEMSDKWKEDGKYVAKKKKKTGSSTSTGTPPSTGSTTGSPATGGSPGSTILTSPTIGSGPRSTTRFSPSGTPTTNRRTPPPLPPPTT